MKTKLEKQANHMWQNYEAANQRFWQEYEQLLKVSRSQIIKRPKREPEPLGVNTSRYTLYEVEGPKTRDEKMLAGFELLFTTVWVTAFITGLIGNSMDASTLQYVFLYLVIFVIIFGILWEPFFKKNKNPQILGNQTLNFAPDHITIENGDETKKIEFKYLEKVQYQQHSFKLTAKFPNHGDYVYFIPLFDSKGQKLPQSQAKQVYDQLKMGMQNNR
ncbi:MAG TPA: hypothetical protein DCS93_12145 [Microscillaceae bacterium]|nr:hypothetical protein [Microscillaceae bacterium]